MTPPAQTPPSPDAAASSALGAFLRGVERRGLVFARLLAGSDEAGTEALAWSLDRFRDEAGRTAFGDWPRRFWALLLAAPTLRQPPAGPAWDPGFEWLSRLGHGPRAALLLRLVAGLAESDAAAVLGVARPTYRLGLQRALPHQDDGSPDIEAWQALGRASQEMLRGLPAGSAAAARSGEDGPAGHGRVAGDGRVPLRRGVRVALWLVALATAAALVASFLAGDSLPAGLDEAPGHILSEPLAEAEPPAGRYGEEEALALHPDLALLLDAAEREAQADPAATDPGFYAWLVGGGEAEDRATAGERPGSSQTAAASAAPDASPPAPVSVRPESPKRPAVERLDALGPEARARLEQQRARWDALPYSERGAQRERALAWDALPRAERQLLRQAAAQHAARSPDGQAALRAPFDELDGSLRRGWLLGPDLGADYPRLHPLIAQVPEDARATLLDAIRGLDPQARDDLAVLAVRTPPQSRAELRIELLATPPAQRARWLRRRVAPVDASGR